MGIFLAHESTAKVDIGRIISDKKRGIPLAQADIMELIAGFTTGEVTDAQMAAFLMAVYFTGLSEDETVSLALALSMPTDVVSGERLLPADIGFVTLDLQSTGGVGDKAWLIAIAVVAAVMNGKGKLVIPRLFDSGEMDEADKLSSIPGFNTSLSVEAFLDTMSTCGCAAAKSPPSLSPIERRLFALRSATQTVDSIPLIAAGTVARALATGVDAIVFDVKVGSGALTKTIGEARKLCRMLTQTAMLVGIRTTAVMTNMDKPLGRTIGGALEIMEVIKLLNGGQNSGDLFEVAIELGGAMLATSEVCGHSLSDCREQAASAIASGAALAKLREIIAAQGGNHDVTHDYSLFGQAASAREVFAEISGYIGDVDCEGCGKAAKALGTGTDFAAGIVLDKLTGDWVNAGECLATLYTSSGEKSALDTAEEIFLRSYTIVQRAQKRLSPILR